MATTKEIKNRIKSVKDTQKITNAMYLISSTKMRKAKKEMEATKPYFDLLRKEIKRIFQSEGNITSRLIANGINTKQENSTCAFLVITADKGLAGAYNQNVIKEAISMINKASAYKLFVVGEYGRHYFTAHGYDIEQSFLYTAQNPNLDRAREIMEILVNGFIKREFDKIYICYTDFKNGMSGGVATHTRLFPFDKDTFFPDEDDIITSKVKYTFEPDVETVLLNVIPSYLSGFIYSALVDSFCSEQNARMAAMDAANENAQELLNHLSLEYNHVRQGAITQEITEISSGARGLKMAAAKKKKKQDDKKEDEVI